jgi:DNA-binding response OmpR family regulator
MSQVSTLSRVFVVDDEPSVAKTLVRILRHGGYDATPFTNSQEALLAARADAPQLLLAEANMPSLSGADLGNAVRKCSPGCKVLLTSGTYILPDLHGNRRADELEFEVLDKPLHMAELLGKVQCEIGRAKPPQPVRLLTLEKCSA